MLKVLFPLAAMLLLGACDNDGDTMGNGPGNADGLGGRSDPPAATTDEAPNEAATVDPQGAMTTPDGTTEDTGKTPPASRPGD